MQTEKKTNLQGKFIAEDNMIMCSLGDCPLPINLQTSSTFMRGCARPGPVCSIGEVFLGEGFRVGSVDMIERSGRS
jgi:hypothetical protein